MSGRGETLPINLFEYAYLRVYMPELYVEYDSKIDFSMCISNNIHMLRWVEKNIYDDNLVRLNA